MTAKLQRFNQEKQDGVFFVPLGGCGFFGANIALYGHAGKWIIVDCGMGFADDTMPGIDIILPDITFLHEIKDDILGFVITHGHEDHIGALEHYWPELRLPIYASPFVTSLLKEKFSSHNWAEKVEFHPYKADSQITLGGFHIDVVAMAHSIPEMFALHITTSDGVSLLHTGDWKVDEEPIVGHKTDFDKLSDIGQKGIRAILGDSTNAMVPGHSGSEKTVVENLTDLIGEFSQAIVISCFSSNVARLKSISMAAEANGRVVALLGRSLWRMDRVARENGYLQDVKPFLTEDDIRDIDRDKLIIICTGSQGEPRAVLNRMANKDFRSFQLAEGDAVFLSSRTIPGNEKSIDRLKNKLMLAGVDVVTDRDAPIHVSGHAYRDEIRKLLSTTQPELLISLHGEQMQLDKHTKLAMDCGVQSAATASDGDVLHFPVAGGVKKVDEVHVGMCAIEGKRIVNIDHEAILMRKRIMYNGIAVVTIVVDERDGVLLADPQITTMGLLDENCETEGEHLNDVIEQLDVLIENMPEAQRMDDHQLSEAVRVTTRRYFRDHFVKKPQTRVHLVRV